MRVKHERFMPRNMIVRFKISLDALNASLAKIFIEHDHVPKQFQTNPCLTICLFIPHLH